MKYVGFLITFFQVAAHLKQGFSNKNIVVLQIHVYVIFCFYWTSGYIHISILNYFYVNKIFWWDHFFKETFNRLEQNLAQ